jgi:DDE superfamily endonuclease
MSESTALSWGSWSFTANNSYTDTSSTHDSQDSSLSTATSTGINSSVKEHRRRYEISQKLDILQFVDAFGPTAASKVYKINRNVLSKWKSKRLTLEAFRASNSFSMKELKHRKNVGGAGRPNFISKELEAHVVKFVDDRQRDELVVTIDLLIAESRLFDSRFLNVERKKLSRYIWKVLHRNNIVRRRRTHVAQLTRIELSVMEDWLDEVRLMMESDSVSYDRVANFDETSVAFGLSTETTICKKGVREVSIRSAVSKQRCTAMLGVTTMGHKFPPFLIFRGKTNAKVHKEVRGMQKEMLENGESVRMDVQEKGWMDEAVMLPWID